MIATLMARKEGVSFCYQGVGIIVVVGSLDWLGGGVSGKGLLVGLKRTIVLRSRSIGRWKVAPQTLERAEAHDLAL